MSKIILLITFQIHFIVGRGLEDGGYKTLNQQRNHIIHKTNHNSTKVKSETNFVHLEKLGELYYQNQKVEREPMRKWASDFHILTGNYPCIRGVTPIGLATALSVEDGHKFGCGIPYISGPPVVYSFGSHNQQDFETAIMQLRPDASIFTFELVRNITSFPNLTF